MNSINLPVGSSRVARPRGIVGQVGWQTSDRSILAVVPLADGSARVYGLRPGAATLTLFVSMGGPSTVRAVASVTVGGLPVVEIAWADPEPEYLPTPEPSTPAPETTPTVPPVAPRQAASWGYWPSGLR